MKRLIGLATVVLTLGVTAVASADVNSVTPSTNDINRTKGWAHVDQVGLSLQFTSTRNFYSCFEYRTDGDTSQQISPDNPNTLITDGLYPYICEKDSSDTLNIRAKKYVEVRMVFGAESDERFDWTRFDVGKQACKNGGWKDFGFANQGQCVRYEETGKDSR